MIPNLVCITLRGRLCYRRRSGIQAEANLYYTSMLLCPHGTPRELVNLSLERTSISVPIGIFILGMRGRRQETACDGVKNEVVSNDQGGEVENRMGAITVKGAECIAILHLSPLIRPGNEISRRPVKSGTRRTHTSSGQDARRQLHLAWVRSDY